MKPTDGTPIPSRPDRMGPAEISYMNGKSLLTPSSGFIGRYKFTLNPYSGCAFACDYCYARFFAPTATEQQTWGVWVKVKANAVDLLRRARKSKSIRQGLRPGDAVYMSSVTDPYQPIERKLELTRRILEDLIEVQPRLTVQTRSPIATRDIDLFKQFKRIRVNFTVTTDSDEVRQRYEPQCPSIQARLKAAETVAAGGIPIGISISPMLPLKNAEAFGRRVAEFNAAEYVTQYMKPTKSLFRAGSSFEALRKMQEDGWTEQDYRNVRATLSRILGSRRPLREGSGGFAPP